MIYERKSSRELVMSHSSFKRFGFRRVCQMLGLAVPEKER